MDSADQWKLVPVEPTKEMLTAVTGPDGGGFAQAYAADNYRAMLNASPTRTQGADERDVPCGDIAAFGELIDDYQCAQIDGTHADRAAARIALMNACRAALASSDAQADGGKSEAVANSLHRDIMNIPCKVPEQYNHSDGRLAYKAAHRDARHAAAAIVSAGPQAECAPRAQLSDERIHEVIAGIYGACATDQEMRLARAILDADKEQ